MVMADRTPPGSQRSTWVELGHARWLGRRESASAYWFFAPPVVVLFMPSRKQVDFRTGLRWIRAEIDRFLDGYVALA